MLRKTAWIPIAVILWFGTTANFARGDDTSDDSAVAVERRNDFFAARGRRSSGDSNDPNDFFWANRGKRSNDAHVVSLRDKVFNAPRPNGFLFPTTRFGTGKRSGQETFNMPRPNGFFFPSVKAGKRNTFNQVQPHGYVYVGKRAGGFNLPSPNGFLFPTKGKRSNKGGNSGHGNGNRFNVPMPNGFFFPSNGKRSGPAMWNMARPNGFFFPSVQRMGLEDSSNLEDEYLQEAVAELIDYPEEDQDKESIDFEKKDDGTFFAGRGKRENQDGSVNVADIFAGRGKKDDAPSDIFFAGRGK